MKLQVN
jgi:hypothetical protein